ncbi:hypothetical protein ACFPRL_22490 [Pseudoclavibacter helvolus]
MRRGHSGSQRSCAIWRPEGSCDQAVDAEGDAHRRRRVCGSVAADRLPRAPDAGARVG